MTFKGLSAGSRHSEQDDGTFEIRIDRDVLFSLLPSCEGRFPESEELKQLVRDRFDPSREVGRSDRAPVGKSERR